MSIKLGNFQVSIVKLLLTILLLVGIGIGVYLVQFQQIFKPKAAVNASQAFEIKDDQGNIINCTGNTCYTNSFDVTVRVKDLTPFLSE